MTQMPVPHILRHKTPRIRRVAHRLTAILFPNMAVIDPERHNERILWMTMRY